MKLISETSNGLWGLPQTGGTSRLCCVSEKSSLMSIPRQESNMFSTTKVAMFSSFTGLGKSRMDVISGGGVEVDIYVQGRQKL